MKVSVVIPAYNEEGYIAQCLQCIKGQIDPADEIIVIDNNSTDKTAEIARAFGATVIHETKQGMIPARNRGFDEAKNEIIARTDADAHVPYNWIQQIKEHFQKDSLLLGLSGTSHFYDMPNIVQHKNWPPKVLTQSSVNHIMKHDVMLGPNMAIRKTAWNIVKHEVCKNDKDVHEDMDLAIHLAEHGKVQFDETLVVNVSFRRFKKLAPYFEYPLRYIKTIEKHKKWLKRFKKATSMQQMFKKTKKEITKTLQKTHLIS